MFDLMTEDEAAARLGIDRETLRQHMRLGRLRYYDLGTTEPPGPGKLRRGNRVYRFTAEQLTDFLKSREQDRSLAQPEAPKPKPVIPSRKPLPGSRPLPTIRL